MIGRGSRFSPRLDRLDLRLLRSAMAPAIRADASAHPMNSRETGHPDRAEASTPAVARRHAASADSLPSPSTADSTAGAPDVDGMPMGGTAVAVAGPLLTDGGMGDHGAMSISPPGSPALMNAAAAGAGLAGPHGPGPPPAPGGDHGSRMLAAPDPMSGHQVMGQAAPARTVLLHAGSSLSGPAISGQSGPHPEDDVPPADEHAMAIDVRLDVDLDPRLDLAAGPVLPTGREPEARGVRSTGRPRPGPTGSASLPAVAVDAVLSDFPDAGADASEIPRPVPPGPAGPASEEPDAEGETGSQRDRIFPGLEFLGGVVAISLIGRDTEDDAPRRRLAPRRRGGNGRSRPGPGQA